MASDTADFYRHSGIVLSGTVLAIDPSSGAFNRQSGEQSNVGYALFRAGELVDSGVVAMDGRALPGIWDRLRDLYDCMATQFERPDVLVIEKIKGSFAHEYLKMSIPVIATAVRASVVLEMNISTWKSRATAGYTKSDENDAIEIGRVLIKLCKEGQ